MSFIAPKWDSVHAHYLIETTKEYRDNTDDHLLIARDTTGSTVFTDMDSVHNVTDDMIEELIAEGAKNKWFSKLPSHEQLMKRVRHTFSKLAADTDTRAILTVVLMTPKLLTLVWTPSAEPAPGIYFEDSDSELDPQLEESVLPPVTLRDTQHETHEEYLLTRLRAAKARVETEQIRMEYFETTGRMPPDSDSDNE